MDTYKGAKMKTLIKKAVSIALITNILTIGSVFFYMLPFSYAATTWDDVTSNEELVQAFQAYCKSRNLAIEGSVADAVTAFTTSTFNSICDNLGIDSTALQANLKKSTDSNVGLQFLFDDLGITAYNRIFAEFLQNNNLSVGDTVEDTELYNGMYMDNALLYVTSTNISGLCDGSFFTLTSRGTPYISSSGLVSVYEADSETSPYKTLEFNIDGVRLLLEVFYYNSDGSYYAGWGSRSQVDQYHVILPSSNVSYTNYFGYAALVYSTYDQKTYFCEITQENDWSHYYISKPSGNSIDTQPVNAIISITTNNLVINNNTYEGDTIINQEGGTGGDSGGGGSGGGDTTIDVSFPSITLPDLSGINWSLEGLTTKFPFCIPFDLYHFVDVLDAEPETPAFTGSINLIVTTWDLDYDLSAFDDLAAIVRNVEFIGFCLGLIFITRKIIKG